MQFLYLCLTQALFFLVAFPHNTGENAFCAVRHRGSLVKLKDLRFIDDTAYELFRQLSDCSRKVSYEVVLETAWKLMFCGGEFFFFSLCILSRLLKTAAIGSWYWFCSECFQKRNKQKCNLPHRTFEMFTLLFNGQIKKNNTPIQAVEPSVIRFKITHTLPGVGEYWSKDKWEWIQD